MGGWVVHPSLERLFLVPRISRTRRAPPAFAKLLSLLVADSVRAEIPQPPIIPNTGGKDFPLSVTALG